MLEKWFKDIYAETRQHAYAVAELSVGLARHIGLLESEIRKVATAAALHDVGKVMVPDHILFKTEPLTKEELFIVHGHCLYGRSMLEGCVPPDVLAMVTWHHENQDGSGYAGLKGSEIPVGAKIIHVTDVWDALVTDRCYRTAWTTMKAEAYMRQQSGTMFDREVLGAFLDGLGREKLGNRAYGFKIQTKGG